mmetsp:Transcript_4509/g.17067  ORF Transcript_4509/g.17067 Transcript_4509/m.17067 type:complete len:252 (+) Transcript_4509:763-1518(+)
MLQLVLLTLHTEFHGFLLLNSLQLSSLFFLLSEANHLLPMHLCLLQILLLFFHFQLFNVKTLLENLFGLLLLLVNGANALFLKQIGLVDGANNLLLALLCFLSHFLPHLSANLEELSLALFMLLHLSLRCFAFLQLNFLLMYFGDLEAILVVGLAYIVLLLNERLCLLDLFSHFAILLCKSFLLFTITFLLLVQHTLCLLLVFLILLTSLNPSIFSLLEHTPSLFFIHATLLFKILFLYYLFFSLLQFVSQ